MHQAASSSNLNVLELLLDQGNDIESFSLRDSTPLHYAAQSGNIATVTFLLNRKANIEAFVENDVSATPLLRAVVNNKIDIARPLLKNGAKVSAKGTITYVLTTFINLF